MSDLHFEHMPDYGRSLFESLDARGADALVLAGDVLSLKLPDLALEAFRKFVDAYGRVLYVPGNHEFYRTSPRWGAAVLQVIEAELPGFRVLEAGRAVELDGVRFLGGTMWFPPHRLDRVLRVALNDFAFIEGFTPWVWEQNRALTDFFERELRQGDVVVTHHLPSPRSSPPFFRDTPLEIFFVSDQESLIERRKPRAWLHGHTHRACSYRLGETEVRCNPKGYPRERSGGYAPMVVEV